MASDLTVIMENRPGTMAEVGEALGKAGINIEGMCGFPCEGEGIGHLLVEDAAAARRALEGAGIEVRAERPVLIIDLPNEPGAMGATTRRLANAGVNVDLAYVSYMGVVLGVDDMEKAQAAL